MPSTTRATLKNLFRPFARSATINLDKAESQFAYRYVSQTATLAESALFAATGPCYVKAVYFFPDTAITSDNSNKYVIVIKNKGTAGNGTTEVASFTTYQNALVAYVKKTIYGPVAPGYAMANATTLSVTATLTGSATLQGYFVVEYTPIID